MVLVHGLGGSAVNWMAVGPGLATRARGLAPDLAGFGRSPLAGRSACVQANQRLLGRFIDEFAVDLVPLASIEALVRNRPEWTVHVLDGIGHVPQLEAPRRFVELVTAWLGDQTAEPDRRAV